MTYEKNFNIDILYKVSTFKPANNLNQYWRFMNAVKIQSIMVKHQNRGLFYKNGIDRRGGGPKIVL